MSNFNVRKEKEFQNREIDDCIKQDRKLANFLKEGKSFIESVMNKKYNRLEKYSKKKREINLRRMKEDLAILDIQDQRRKEDLLLEKELRLLKFEEQVEQKALKKN